MITVGTTADRQVVCMKTVMELDPTVAEGADLPPGWSAERLTLEKILNDIGNRPIIVFR
jgi:hypothetical protein